MNKLLSISKKKWIFAHIVLLCIAIATMGISNITVNDPFIVRMFLGTTIFGAFFSIIYFPVSIFMLGFFSSLWMLIPNVLSTIMFYALSILYYFLWIRKDSLWNEKTKIRIQYIRIVWFFISVVSSLVVLSQFIS